MGKVFLSVPLGEDGHVKDGPIKKLDLEAFWCFLGGHQICCGGHMGWVADCSAALSCTPNPSVPWGS